MSGVRTGGFWMSRALPGLTGAHRCGTRRPERGTAPAGVVPRGFQGRIANARAGNPKPFSTFGQVTTMMAPVAGTLSRLASTSTW